MSNDKQSVVLDSREKKEKIQDCAVKFKHLYNSNLIDLDFFTGFG